MADKEAVRTLLERYCTSMNSGDRATWLDCFAPDETMTMEQPRALSAAISSARAASHSARSLPSLPSTSSAEPILMVMRR